MKDLKSILLVEDDSVDAIIIQRVFKHLKIENPLVIHPNGEDALNWLSQQKNQMPGLILLDLNMPRMNGLEFLHAIKRDPQLCLIPVVVLTTSDNTNDLLESYKLNASGYLLKSLDYEQFTNTILSLKNYWSHNQLAY